MKKKFVISTLGVLIGITVASITSSIAWFSGVKPITSLTGNIAGAAYAGFFHSGDGLSEETAFEITTPEHYKNLVEKEMKICLNHCIFTISCSIIDTV